jgi:hypothetical protein
MNGAGRFISLRAVGGRAGGRTGIENGRPRQVLAFLYGTDEEKKRTTIERRAKAVSHHQGGRTHAILAILNELATHHLPLYTSSRR